MKNFGHRVLQDTWSPSCEEKNKKHVLGTECKALGLEGCCKKYSLFWEEGVYI